MKKIKEALEEILDQTIDKLIELQLNISDNPEKLVQNSLISMQKENAELQESNWSIWMMSTTTHFAVVACQDSIGGIIPEDGTFISGILIQSGLTEEMAMDKIDEFGVKAKLHTGDRKISGDLS